MLFLIQGWKAGRPVLGSMTQQIKECKRLVTIKKLLPKMKSKFIEYGCDEVHIYSFNEIYNDSTYKLVASLYTDWIPDMDGNTETIKKLKDIAERLLVVYQESTLGDILDINISIVSLIDKLKSK